MREMESKPQGFGSTEAKLHRDNAIEAKQGEVKTYLQGGADEDEEKKKTRGKHLDLSTFLFRNNSSS